MQTAMIVIVGLAAQMGLVHRDSRLEARPFPPAVPSVEPRNSSLEPRVSMIDPTADSLYRAAREALNKGDYRRAADVFGQIQRRYPDSGYAGDALYWRAYALYKANGTDELRAAMASLAEQKSRYANAATGRDAGDLRVRICGELARRGDEQCAKTVREQANEPCSAESMEMKIAALNALQQMRSEDALPILRKVLSNRSDCTAELRRKAVFLVADQNSADATDILLDVIRNDPSQDVRREAVWWLSEVSGDRALAVLDSIVRTSTDEGLQRKALEALGNGGEKSRQLLARIIERPGTSDEIKGSAIQALGNFGNGDEDAQYLRDLYPKLGSEALKEKVVEAVGNSGKSDSQRWLLDLAQNDREPLELRKKALFWAGNGDGGTAPLISLYEKLRDPELKAQMIFVYSNRDDKVATDKLIDIARHDPDREMRKKAIFWLGQKDDPRVKQILLEIINQ
jgi:tetratricopeptide (TPR) repeat protein